MYNALFPVWFQGPAAAHAVKNTPCHTFTLRPGIDGAGVIFHEIGKAVQPL